MTIIKKAAVLSLCAALLCVFFSLRIDTSKRHYFGIDDLVVIQLVDMARHEQHWQPDWYATKREHVSEKNSALAEQEIARIQATHPHHYNFAAHISLSSLLAYTLDQLGLPINTTQLLRGLATGWDGLSLILLSLLALKLFGGRAALICAAAYSVLPLAVQSSHYARPDALLTAQAIAIIWLSYLLLIKKNHLTGLCLCIGTVLGFAVATKASSLLYGLFPLATFSYLLLSKQQSFIRLLTAGLVLVIALLATLCAYFALVDIHWRDFVDSTLAIQRYYQQPLPPDIRYDPSITGHVLHFANYLQGTLGLFWLAIAAFGAAYLLRFHKPLACLLVLPIALLIAYYLSQSVFFDRSHLALMPLLCLLAAAAIDQSIRYSARFAFARPALCQLLLCAALTALCLWPAAQVSFTLQQHIGKPISETRKQYQQALLEQWRKETQVNLWLKLVDRADITHQQLPTLNNPNPRLYVVEHFNDPNSDHYLKLLEEQGWKQVGHYRGDFAALPTNSLHIAHEAAHFYYFIRPIELAVTEVSDPALSK